MIKRLWNDEAGAILSAEVVLVATILVIGVVTGLTSVRDAVVTELADVGQAIANVDQSYTVHGSLAHSSATANFGFVDNYDYCDRNDSGFNTRCVVICGNAFAAPVNGPDGDSN